MRGSISQSKDHVGASVYADGAVVATGDGVFLSRRVNDSFAIVDAGAPGVGVRHENRLVGHTDASGKLLVTGLHGYQKNRLSIDAKSLPLDAYIEEAHNEAIPYGRRGVGVRFNVRSSRNSALVQFKTADGSLVSAGSTVTLKSTGKEFVVGYDGQAYIEDLSAANSVVIKLEDRECRATFAFRPSTETQAYIEGVVCH